MNQMYGLSTINQPSNKTLIHSEKIEAKRQQLFYVASIYGMSAEETLRCSRELDGMIIRVQTDCLAI
jgi:Spo0E like sporulation regulatory protein.